MYASVATSSTPDQLSLARREAPDDPTEYAPGKIGVSSRWWYLPRMYRPICPCGRCTRPAADEAQPADPGQALTSMLQRRKAAHDAGAGEQLESMRTGKIYSIPRCGDRRNEKWAPECMTWPRYHQGSFSIAAPAGESMLELTQDEREALRIVVFRPKVKKETFGAPHQFNWKKVGVSTAYFREERLTEDSMPTPRAKAAFLYLLDHNKYYKAFHAMHNGILDNGSFRTISSFELFINHMGIECAMWPWLYPETRFTDTGLYANYKEESGDDTNRVVSIAESWTRKVLSSCRVYGESRGRSIEGRHVRLCLFSALPPSSFVFPSFVCQCLFSSDPFCIIPQTMFTLKGPS